MNKSKFFLYLFLSSLILSITSCDDDSPAPDPGPTTGCVDSILLPPYSNGLVAYYKFVNGSPQDESGNGHHGVINGVVLPTSNPSGNPDCAVSFNSTSTGHISISSHSDFDFDETTPLSIVLWYRQVYVAGTGGNYRLLIGRDSGIGLRCPDTYGEYSIGTYDCMKPVFGLGTSRVWDNTHGLTTTSCDSIMMYYENEGWQNLIAIYDPTQPVLKWQIYRNGILTSEGASVCGGTPYTVTHSGDLIIGKDFLGDIDDIKIYNRLLTAGEINFLKGYVSPCCE